MENPILNNIICKIQPNNLLVQPLYVPMTTIGNRFQNNK